MTNIRTLIVEFGRLVALAIPIVAGLALLGFFWGLTKFIFAAGSEDNREDGKRIMISGLIALFVMVSVWGIIRFFQADLGIIGGPSIIQIQRI